MIQYAKEDINAPDSWCCIDCGINTAPGFSTREQLRQAFARDFSGRASVVFQANDRSEVYHVKDDVWQSAGIEPFGGCLCIGCIEKRIGRQLTPGDFERNHPFNSIPGTARLLDRRERRS